jgi:hypothetical protein
MRKNATEAKRVEMNEVIWEMAKCYEVRMTVDWSRR